MYPDVQRDQRKQLERCGHMRTPRLQCLHHAPLLCNAQRNTCSTHDGNTAKDVDTTGDTVPMLQLQYPGEQLDTWQLSAITSMQVR